MSESDVIKDTVEDLTAKIEKSTKKLEELRNLNEELRSKIFVENSFRRYLQYRLNELKKSEQTNAIK